MVTNRGRVAWGWALGAGLLWATGAGAGLESRGQNFVDLPTPEVSPGQQIGTTGAQDEAVAVWGEDDGELVMITLENRKLFAATSSDGGTTFAPAVQFAGPPSEPPVYSFRLAPTWNALHVAYLVGDPDGDVGLRTRRSDTMGRTWTAPAVLVARGNPRHGIEDLALHANGAGRVAVLFKETWEGKDVWAMVSSDHGVTWTSPVRLDAANAEGVRPSDLGDVHVSDNGTVHAAFIQSRGAGNRIWYTRSTDGGATFSPEVNFDAIVTPSVSASPDLTSNPAGTVLLSFWDRTHNFVDVVRSVNDGVSFTLTAQKPIPASTKTVIPRLLMAPNAPDVLLAYVVSGELRTWLSQNSGASFDWNAVVATSVDKFHMTRTLSGYFVLAWSDTQWTPGIWAAASQGGLLWGPPRRADQGPGAAADSILGSLTIVGSETAWLAYLDRRDDNGTQYNVYAADAAASALDFTGRERRADTDEGTANLTRQGGTLATDGSSRVYAAIYAWSAGRSTELWMTRSLDNGRTFLPAQKLSAHDPNLYEVSEPVMQARSDGKVYVVWQRSEIATGAMTLMFARSSDFGATWSVETALTGPMASLDGYAVAVTSAAVVVFWSDVTSVFARRSTDSGATFSAPADVDGNPNTLSRFPLACAQGNRIMLGYEGNPFGSSSVAARLSTDSGATWNSIEDIGASTNGQNLGLACDATVGVVATWSAGMPGVIYARRMNGIIWSGLFPIGPPVGDFWFNQPVWAGGANWVVAVGDTAGPVYTARSTDGGLTWSPLLRRDDAAPQPLADRTFPLIASDGAGNVWLSWWDRSAGQASIAVRHSLDAGLNFGAVRRADKSQPQGVSWTNISHGIFANPGAGIIASLSQRESGYTAMRVNTWSAVDLDADGSPDASDCNDESAAVFPGATEGCDGIANDCNAPAWPAVPPNESDADADGFRECADNCPGLANPTQANLDGDALGDACDPDRDGDGVDNGVDCQPDNPAVSVGPAEVVPVQASRPTPTSFQLVWPAVSGATAYDVARGTVAQLRTDGDTTAAVSQICGQASTTYTDSKVTPVGSTWYYIVRARAAACGGSWGANSSGVSRSAPAACP